MKRSAAELHRLDRARHGKDWRKELTDKLDELARLVGLRIADVQNVLVPHSEALREKVRTRSHHVEVIDERPRFAMIAGHIAEDENGSGIGRASCRERVYGLV